MQNQENNPLEPEGDNGPRDLEPDQENFDLGVGNELEGGGDDVPGQTDQEFVTGLEESFQDLVNRGEAELDAMLQEQESLLEQQRRDEQARSKTEEEEHMSEFERRLLERSAARAEEKKKEKEEEARKLKLEEGETIRKIDLLRSVLHEEEEGQLEYRGAPTPRHSGRHRNAAIL